MSRALSLAGCAVTMCFLALALVVVGLHGAGSEPQDAAFGPALSTGDIYGALPLHFEPNEGQTDPSVSFLSHGRRYTLFLTSSEVVLSLGRGALAPLRMKLVGAESEPAMVGLDRLPGKSNYLNGRPENWHTEIPHYAKIAYRQIYPGIDLVIYGSQGNLEYDFIVAPNADSGMIRLGFEGADEVALDDQGNLVLQVPGGEMVHQRPFMYQNLGGARHDVAGGYLLNDASPPHSRRGSEARWRVPGCADRGRCVT